MSCLDGSGQTGAEFTVHEETFFFASFTFDKPKKKKKSKEMALCNSTKSFFRQADINRKQGKVCLIREPAPLGQNLADITILLMLTTIFSTSRVGRGATNRPEKRWKGGDRSILL